MELTVSTSANEKQGRERKGRGRTGVTREVEQGGVDAAMSTLGGLGIGVESAVEKAGGRWKRLKRQSDVNLSNASKLNISGFEHELETEHDNSRLGDGKSSAQSSAPTAGVAMGLCFLARRIYICS